MTVHDLRCDVCGDGIAVPEDGVRFTYHAGKPLLRDSSGLMCRPCWASVGRPLADARAARRCAVCGQMVTRYRSLHVRGADDPQTWRLCDGHAVEFLNRLRTVQPKIDSATFRFPFAHLETDADQDSEQDEDSEQDYE